MSVTITQVRRAVEEAAEADADMRATVKAALRTIAADGTALTLIANSINQKTGATLQVNNPMSSAEAELYDEYGSLK
jgi:hypothetical protein